MYNATKHNAATLASILHARQQPAILHGLVNSQVRRLAAQTEFIYPSYSPIANPHHVFCGRRFARDRADAIHWDKSVALDQAICEWANSTLYDVPLWHALWASIGQAVPRGHAVVSGNRAVGFHSHGPTLNALLTGRRKWFLFDGSIDGEDGAAFDHQGGWQALPLLHALARNRSRPRTATDWLRFAYPRAAAVRGVRATFECTQTAGTVLFVPNQFSHAILSLGKSRAVFFIADQTVWTE